MARKQANRVDVYEQVTQRVIDLLDAGTVPWHKPWNATSGMPRSMSTGKTYRGVNVFLLAVTEAAEGYPSSWWGTYRQIQEMGGQVRKGERATSVVFWKLLEKVDDGNALQIPFLRSFSVFNAGQADGLLETYTTTSTTGTEWAPLGRCEQVAAGYRGPVVRHGGDRACYSPRADVVSMPERTAFENAEGYYSTLFHELTHSTGHASRLARPDLLEFHAFGDQSYSREELVAEMGAAMLAGIVGIEQATVPASAAYVASWLRVLKGDKKLIVQAAAQAQKAADLILGTKFGEVAA